MLRLRWSMVLIIAGVLTLPLHAAIITVDDDAPADYTSIQNAIDAAISGQDEVVVFPGTYFEAINFNGKAIMVRSSGGAAVTTIDGTGNFHVVQCVTNEGAGTVLEGFTITGGNANGNYPDNVGGGMCNDSSSPTVTHCTFSGNSAGVHGGGMSNTSSSPTVTHCTFSGNSGRFGGGMSNSANSSPTVTHCIFSGNLADDNGGGMHNWSSSPTVTHCTFSGNSAPSGGGMSDDNSSPRVTHCILWGDTPNELFSGNGATITASFSDLQGGLPAGSIDGGGNIDADPLFVDADGPDNVAGTDDDNLRLKVGSPCFNAGSNAAVSAGVTTDLDMMPRIVNCVVDMGAYEFNGAALGDSDGDGIADDCDLCLGNDFTGDSDGDGVCDDLDLCPGFDDDDPDADNDTVPDQCDVCEGFDDTLDDDADNIPNDCDVCPGFDDNGPDSDGDGIPFGCDRCEGFDDNGPDTDNDGTPDACDDCILPGDHNCDGIVNLIDQALLALHWLEQVGS